MALSKAGLVQVGTGVAVDTSLIFDGNAIDYRLGIDDSADTFEIGIGSTHATTPQMNFSSSVIVVNEGSSDYDFRVETNGNANMLFISGGNDVVGIGAEGDLGVGLHVKSGDSSATPIASADELVVEGSASAGISILTGNDDNGYLCFGDDGDADIGNINYRHDTNMMRFNTNGTERLQIANNGDIHIPGTAGDGYMTIKGGSTEAYVVHNGTATGNTTLYMFKVGGTEVGTINRTSSATIYNTSSDYRLKENETAITDGITRIKQLKPYKFNFKVDPDTKVDGFFAHEVSSIVPEAISGEKDAVYENKDIKPQGIDQSKIVPLLTAALKESITKIEALEARVTTLEG